MAKTYKRSFFRITDSRFQRDFIFLAVFIAVMSSLIVMTGTWFIIQDYKSLIGEVSETLGRTFSSESSIRVNNAWLMMAMACLINMITVALLAFTFSRRVAGVLFRLQKELTALAEGNKVTVIVPREGDFFPELVETANRLLREKGS